jgi:uncharacterized protein (DUF1810 family)
MQVSYNLNRFLRAQDYTYANVLEEIKNGQKQSGWMWFIFPQIKGLGLSREAQYYGLRDLEETRQYLAHPILGSRLAELTSALMKTEGKSAFDIFGFPDDVKLKSSMTLFSVIDKDANSLFNQVLRKFYFGDKDRRTLQVLMKINKNMK